MVNAANQSIIKILHETKNKFVALYENSFLVLPDGKTVVGSDGLNYKNLIVEDITLRNPKKIGTQVDKILSVNFDSLTQSLLVGDFEGHVKQYKKKDESFTMVKNYGNIGIGF